MDFVSIDKINWCIFSGNPNAIHLLKQNPEKVVWNVCSGNPNIFELDYNMLKERCSTYKEELIIKVMHPSRIKRYLDMGIETEELVDYL
jgi:hypothetical protein